MIKWERLGLLRSPALVIAAMAFIAVGVFQIYTPAGWITLGVLLAVLAFMLDYQPPTQGSAQQGATYR